MFAERYLDNAGTGSDYYIGDVTAEKIFLRLNIHHTHS